MSTKLIKCLELLKNKTNNDSKLHKQIITIVKSLYFDISYITDYFLKDTYSTEDIKILWNNTKSNSRWGWTELLLILENNITTYEYTDLIENYFYSEEKLLLSGEQGIANLFANIMRDKLVIFNKQGDGYLYNEITCTYDKKLKCILVDMIPKILIPIIDNIISKLKENDDLEDDSNFKKNKELKNIKTMLQTLRGCQTIYKTAIPKLLNTDFKKNIETPISPTYNKKETIKHKEDDYTQTILKFIKEKCIESTDNKEKYKVQPQLLYDAYKKYCESNNIEFVNIKVFGLFIHSKYGDKKKIQENGSRLFYYLGLKILL